VVIEHIVRLHYVSFASSNKTKIEMITVKCMLPAVKAPAGLNLQPLEK